VPFERVLSACIIGFIQQDAENGLELALQNSDCPEYHNIYDEGTQT